MGFIKVVKQGNEIVTNPVHQEVLENCCLHHPQPEINNKATLLISKPWLPSLLLPIFAQEQNVRVKVRLELSNYMYVYLWLNIFQASLIFILSLSDIHYDDYHDPLPILLLNLRFLPRFLQNQLTR